MNYRIESHIDDLVIEFTSDFSELKYNGKDCCQRLKGGGYIFGDYSTGQREIPRTIRGIYVPDVIAHESKKYLNIFALDKATDKIVNIIINKSDLKYYRIFDTDSIDYKDELYLTRLEGEYAQKIMPTKSARSSIITL